MDDTAPFLRLGPSHARTPLVCAVPHAGRHYPAALLAEAAVPPAVLAQLEDPHADRLVSQAVAEGAVAIVAGIARAWIDLNRAPDDVDPAMAPSAPPRPSLRVASGLGLIPRRLGTRELLHRLPGAEEVADRIACVFQPYHQAIAAALDEAVRHHGFAILIDCHSMPALRGGRAPAIVIGDRHGRSAAGIVSDAAMRAAEASGLRTARNTPYAGAHTLDRHGAPEGNVHALQIEFDRALYLDADQAPRAERVVRLARIVAAIGRDCVDAARPPFPLAAE